MVRNGSSQHIVVYLSFQPAAVVFFFSCNRERKRSRMMAGQIVLCIVINDLTFFLLLGCRRKFSFSLSNSDTACHFHFFLHTHKHTHTLFGLVKMYTFLCSSCLHFHRNCFFVSLVSMEENFFLFIRFTFAFAHAHTHTLSF